MTLKHLLKILLIYPIAIMTTTMSCKPQKKTSQEALDQKYQEIKNAIKEAKNQYKTVTPENSAAIAQLFINSFYHKISPAWQGTKWDFNGTARTPKAGPIACGYFVTTTLQDMGFAIDRIKYAQCPSQQALQHVVQAKHIGIYNNLSFDQFITFLQNRKKDYVALVALDTHIGYIVRIGTKLKMIHSSTLTKGYANEDAAQSAVLRNSKWRSVAYLTDDLLFLKKWIGETE